LTHTEKIGGPSQDQSRDLLRDSTTPRKTQDDTEEARAARKGNVYACLTRDRLCSRERE